MNQSPQTFSIFSCLIIDICACVFEIAAAIMSISIPIGHKHVTILGIFIFVVSCPDYHTLYKSFIHQTDGNTEINRIKTHKSTIKTLHKTTDTRL